MTASLRPTLWSGKVAKESFRVEKRNSDKSVEAQKIPAGFQAFQRTLETAREQLRQIKDVVEPEEADLEIGEICMQEADLVQENLEQTRLQMMHLVQACNEDRWGFEDKSLAIRPDLDILQARICTYKSNIEELVSGVGSPVSIHQAMIEEMRAGITILHTEDNAILQEGSSIRLGINYQIGYMIEKQIMNWAIVLNHDQAIVNLQEEGNVGSETPDKFEDVL